MSSGVSARTERRAAPFHPTAQACAAGTPALSRPENRGREPVVTSDSFGRYQPLAYNSMIPVGSAPACDAARHRAAFIDRSDRARVVVSGADRASYLQGLLTNDIVALKAGPGCYWRYSRAQGRMIADVLRLRARRRHPADDGRAVKETVLAKLDQFIFSEDVQLGDVTDTFAQIGIVGPGAAAIVAAMLSGPSADEAGALGEHGNLRAAWNGDPVIVTRINRRG